MALKDVKDLVIRYDGHPKYISNKIIEDDEIEVIVQKLEMILFTNKGEIFGGISILLNESIAIRSLEIQDNTSFYTFPKNVFISLCDKYDDFKYHFTNIFGKRMLDKTYLNLIVKKIMTIL